MVKPSSQRPKSCCQSPRTIYSVTRQHLWMVDFTPSNVGSGPSNNRVLCACSTPCSNRELSQQSCRPAAHLLQAVVPDGDRNIRGFSSCLLHLLECGVSSGAGAAEAWPWCCLEVAAGCVNVRGELISCVVLKAQEAAGGGQWGEQGNAQAVNTEQRVEQSACQ